MAPYDAGTCDSFRPYEDRAQAKPVTDTKANATEEVEKGAIGPIFVKHSRAAVAMVEDM